MLKFAVRTALSTTLLLTFSIAAQAKVESGKKFPDIKLKTLDGGKAFNAKSLNGKIVLVDFWASWCEPCKISMPFLQAMAKKYKGKVEVIGVNVDEDVKAAKSFLKDNPAPDIKMVVDPKQEFASKVDVKTMPSSFILDKKGTVSVAHQGFTEADKEKIEGELKKLLKSK